MRNRPETSNASTNASLRSAVRNGRRPRLRSGEQSALSEIRTMIVDMELKRAEGDLKRADAMHAMSTAMQSQADALLALAAAMNRLADAMTDQRPRNAPLG